MKNVLSEEFRRQGLILFWLLKFKLILIYLFIYVFIFTSLKQTFLSFWDKLSLLATFCCCMEL